MLCATGSASVLVFFVCPLVHLNTSATKKTALIEPRKYQNHVGIGLLLKPSVPRAYMIGISATERQIHAKQTTIVRLRYLMTIEPPGDFRRGSSRGPFDQYFTNPPRTMLEHVPRKTRSAQNYKAVVDSLIATLIRAVPQTFRWPELIERQKRKRIPLA